MQDMFLLPMHITWPFTCIYSLKWFEVSESLDKSYFYRKYRTSYKVSYLNQIVYCARVHLEPYDKPCLNSVKSMNPL